MAENRNTTAWERMVSIMTDQEIEHHLESLTNTYRQEKAQADHTNDKIIILKLQKSKRGTNGN